MSDRPKYWNRWGLRMAELHALSDGEARMLSALCAHANASGEVFASEALLAREAGRKQRTGREILRSLTRRGLISTEQRGQQVPKRVLHDVLPVDQLTLEIDAAAPPGRPARAAAASASLPGGGLSAGRQGGREADSSALQGGGSFCRQKRTEGNSTEEEDARESTGAVTGLVTRLQDVVDLLADAPSVIVEPASINAMLAAFPEPKGYDHLRAAYTVLSWAHEGGLHVSAANRLLEKALLRQTTRERPTSRPPRAAGAPRAERPERKRKPWTGALASALDEQQPVDAPEPAEREVAAL